MTTVGSDIERLSLDQLITFCMERGWDYEVSSEEWPEVNCGLHNGAVFSDHIDNGQRFGWGDTPADALRDAIRAALLSPVRG